jgi:cyclic beta-1,2-glucan synthetase
MHASASAPVSEAQEQKNLRRWEANHIAALAHQLAYEQPAVVHHPGKKPCLIDQLAAYDDALQKAFEHFSSVAAQDLTISHSGEWLLDNNYIVNQAIRLIREDMPKGFYKRLPKLGAGSYEGYPRIFHLANTLVLDRRNPFEPDELHRFIASYQEIHPLTIGELWALPVMLRLAVLGELVHALGRITGMVFQEPLSMASTQAEALGIKDDTIVANCILNLRTLATLDWKRFVEKVSVIEKILSQDPAGVYVHMDFDTRDQYRRVVEELALLAKQEEAQVASEAIVLANSDLPDTCPTRLNQPASLPKPTIFERSSQHHISDSRERVCADFESPASQHVGHYLIDAGRPLLESRLGYRPNLFRRVYRWLSMVPIIPYLVSIGALTFASLIGVVHLVLPTHPAFPMILLAGLMMLVPALTVSVNLAHWIINLIVAAKRLPKMDLSSGIPQTYRTMVVIPTLLCSPDEIDSLLAQLELHYLSNQDPSVTFALLTDFKDAPTEEIPGESELLERAKAGIEALNERYNANGQGLFSLFHRQRVWNPHEGCWMAWERKRGKLIEFNRLIRGSQNTTYREIFSAPMDLNQIYYVVTLDADTLIPDGAVHRLVGTLAHPLNQPRFDTHSGAVTSGYTVLQPRVEIKPTSANQSLFTRIFSGDIALDLYSRAVSDVYQDLFGEGIFVGKGIYHVDAFQRSLEGRVPNNCLLRRNPWSCRSCQRYHIV